jgi:hypothetical protein
MLSLIDQIAIHHELTRNIEVMRDTPVAPYDSASKDVNSSFSDTK